MPFWQKSLNQLSKHLAANNPFLDDGTRSFHQMRMHIEQFARLYSPIFFVQIGAHNGKGADPIHHAIGTNGWHGILVEPVPEYFFELKKNKVNYPNLIFENAAIAESNGAKTFYAVDPRITEKYPPWSSMLSSFDLNVILKSKKEIPDIENYISEIMVETITFDTLLKRHSIRSVDLILIDTEGYDHQVLAQIDLARLKPKMLIFEHKHMTDSNLCETITLLSNFGYGVKKLAEDCIATHANK